MKIINIAIADDHQMVINGLKDMLADASHINIIATYLSGIALLEGLRSSLPDVLVLDIRLPDYSGDELALLILKQYPTIRILTLTNFDNLLYVHTMFNAGVQGYLLKNTSCNTFIEAIETLYNGGEYLSTEMREQLEHFKKSLKRGSSSALALTPREKEILKLISLGFSNQQIAEKVFLSMRTVENYRLNLSSKLEVKNTAGLVRKAIELGLVLY